MMLSAPRVFLAMARDGLVPSRIFAAVHPTFQTPWISTILIGVFVASMTARNPIASYIQKRINEGAFHQVDPQLAARGLLGMFASFVLWQEVFGFKKTQPYDAEEVVRTFVSIFLRGIANE